MYLEFLSVWRHFRGYIEASGGIFELKKALDWSVWYAAKWWREIHNAGAVNLKKPFVKAMYLSLRAKGIIDEDGNILKEVKNLSCLRVSTPGSGWRCINCLTSWGP